MPRILREVPLRPEAVEGNPASLKYYYVAGSTLVPRDSATGKDYSGTGCSFTVGGSDLIMNTELHIPDGSTIKYLRLFYNDTNVTNDVLGYITRYDAGTGTNDLVSVSSTGSGGVGTALSEEITHVYDEFGFGYNLIGWPDISSSTVQVCGLRVAYYAPGEGHFFPVTPCRVADTRGGAPITGGIFGNSAQRNWTVGGLCGIPLADAMNPVGARAVSVTFTVVSTPAAPQGAFLLAWATGSQPSQPVALVTYGPGSTIISSSAIVPLNSLGQMTVNVSHSTHVIMDVNGYFY